jgi:peroxiredoxin Q/BCP
MNFRAGSRAAFAAALALTAAPLLVAGAQQPAAAAPTPEIGTMAPDFTLSGATRFGVLRDSVRLSDFRGQTVVLAFFIRARTKG